MKSTNEERRKANPDRPVQAGSVPASVALAVFLVSAAVVATVLFWQRSWVLDQQEFVPGEPALRSYFSPISFSYVDEKKTEELRSEKVRGLPLVYRVDRALNKKILDRVDGFFRIILEVREERERTGETRWKEMPFRLSTSTLETLLVSPDLETVRGQVMAVLGHCLSRGVLSATEKHQMLGSGIASLLCVNEESQQETVEKTENILTVEDALENASDHMDPELSKKKSVRNLALQVLREILSVNMVFDEDRNREFRKRTAASVAPVEVTVKKNELVIQRGMLVSEDIKQRIDEVHRKLAQRRQRVQAGTGAFLVLLVYLLTFFYFSVFETKYFASKNRLLLFSAVILLSVFLSKAVVVLELSVYLMPTTLAALLLTLLLHSRIGVLGGIMMTVLGGILSGFRTDVMLATLLASLVATFLAFRVRKRSHFLKIGVGIGCAYFLVVTGFQLTQNTPWRDAVQLGCWGFLGAFGTAAASFLILPFLELFFDVITDVTLLELSDLNHPLIKRMMVEAPGTYHHSLVVSSLAEQACERIGAHALLARVGCYFHDIGKVENPGFFSENQGHLYAGHHDSIPPKISFEIIVGHVSRGMRLARKHKLKWAIVDFIAEHQGTGVVYYFYRKAMDLATPGEHVRADDYRYPGPKPQSKETAVALLADSVEAASRSLKDPTPESVQQLVRKIINDKFIDGQLDECALTLQDLHKIQASFVRNLAAMFHTRMKYPPVERPETSPDLFGVNQFYKFRADE